MKNSKSVCKITLLFFFVSCLGFISCETTNSALSSSENTENTIQEELEALNESEIQIESTIQAEQTVQNEPETEEKRTFEFKDQEVFYNIKYTYDYEVVGRDLDYKIIVNDEDKEIVIQYEETDSEEDWKNNYLFLLWPLNLDGHIVWTTHGYARIYKSSQNKPINDFYQQVKEHPDYKIIIRGWSLGSAMAKITARHFVIRTGGEVLIDELTTFGDVKCWLNPFFSIKKYCKRIREYVTENDLVTWCVPFYRRDVTCKVGEKFNFLKVKNSENYHTHYEDYDYSDWE
jgi:hypothetical protein